MPATSDFRLLCGLLLLLSSLSACLSDVKTTGIPEQLTGTACVLNDQTCSWPDTQSPQEQWQVLLEQETDFRLFNLSIHAPLAFEGQTLTLTWTGLEMYLGYYPRLLDLQKTTDKFQLFSQQMSLPICATDAKMHWKLELSANGQPIKTPFTLVFVGR